jgi:hypothetical protein
MEIFISSDGKGGWTFKFKLALMPLLGLASMFN